MKKLPDYSKSEMCEPDEFELRLASQTGHLKNCPFCGRSPLCFSSFREDTGIYGVRISCSDWRCGANVIYTSKDRLDARKHAIEKWERRI